MSLVTVLGGVILAAVVCEAVMALIHFVTEKRGERHRVDPEN